MKHVAGYRRAANHSIRVFLANASVMFCPSLILFADAAWNLESNERGVGIVILEINYRFIFAGYCHIRVNSTLLAEVMAFQLTLNQTWDLRMSMGCTFTDCE